MLESHEINTIQEARNQGLKTFLIRVKLLKDTQLKGVRAYMVFTKLEEYGEILKSIPASELLEKGEFEHSFELVFITKEQEEGIIEDIQNISEVEDVTIEPIGDFASTNSPRTTMTSSDTQTVVLATPNNIKEVNAPETNTVQKETAKKESPKKEEPVETSETEKKYIVFQVGSEELALPIDYVMSIERSMKITRVPNVHAFILGVINLRGIVIPVIDLKHKFTYTYSEMTDASRVIICRFENIEVGFVVDSAKDVLTVKNKFIENAPDIEKSAATEFIKSLIHLDKRIIILLDVMKLFKGSDLN